MSKNKKGNLKTEKVRITPTMAKEWLDLNTKNRNVSDKTVARYAEDIERRNWALTGDTIKFDWNGKLVDGQHRLHACIRAGKAFETYVVRGVDPKAFTKMDQNRVRTSGQILGIENFRYSTTMAATVSAIKEMHRAIETQQFPKGQTWQPHVRSSPDEILAFAKRNEDALVDAIATVKGKEARRLMKPPSTFAAIYFILAESNAQRTREFFELLATGAMLEASSPILRLRYALQDALADTRYKRSAPWKAAMTIKAWNLWLQDKSVSQLRFRTANENFPRPRKRAKSA